MDCPLSCNLLLNLNTSSEKLCSFSQILKNGMKKAFELKSRDIVSHSQGQGAENRPTVMKRRASCSSNLNWEMMSHTHRQPLLETNHSLLKRKRYRDSRLTNEIGANLDPENANLFRCSVPVIRKQIMTVIMINLTTLQLKGTRQPQASA